MNFNAEIGDFLGNLVKDISFMNAINYENALGQVGMVEKFMSKAHNYNNHFLILSHTNHDITSPKITPESSWVEHICMCQGIGFQNAFGVLS